MFKMSIRQTSNSVFLGVCNILEDAIQSARDVSEELPSVFVDIKDTQGNTLYTFSAGSP